MGRCPVIRGGGVRSRTEFVASDPSVAAYRATLCLGNSAECRRQGIGRTRSPGTAGSPCATKAVRRWGAGASTVVFATPNSCEGRPRTTRKGWKMAQTEPTPPIHPSKQPLHLPPHPTHQHFSQTNDPEAWPQLV